MGAKQSILPFFIPMQGCPALCVYCDQRAISGQNAAPAAAEILAALAAFPPDPTAELAFYGGSFTCLPEAEQLRYLQLAEDALAEGRIGGLRVSTRPDAVDAAVCAFLRRHHVVTVELGVQSFDDRVLAASGRGYTAEQALAGCAAVRAAGLRLGIQLMTGLPQQDAATARASLQQALAAGAALLRIYPTLVLRGTELAARYAAGCYQPQTLSEAVELCALLLAEALAAGVPVTRLGLNPSPELEAALLAGPYHPAFGALVREKLKQWQAEALLAGLDAAEPAMLRFPRQDLPLVFGHQRQGMLALAKRWPQLALLPDDDLPAGELRLQTQAGERCLAERDFCQQLRA